jgi:predicted transcriptional regulator
MSITLKEPIRILAERLAKDAGYETVAEYLESLVERAECQSQDREETLAAVREGLEDLAAGRCRPAREVLAEFAKRYGYENPVESDS